MQDYLSAIGLKSIRTKKEMNELVSWCMENPDRMSICTLDNESNLSVCEKQMYPGAYLSIVGEMDEKGNLIPEYVFPYTAYEMISSEAHLSYKKERSRNGYIGMCEDYRLGMALIFQVSNVADLFKNESLGLLKEEYKKVSISALALDATVLLPLYVPKAVLKRNNEDLNRHARLTEEAQAGDPEAVELLQHDDMKHYEDIMKRLPTSDVYTLVESFFMPSGMESNEYYFMGEIRSIMECVNAYTKERFLQMSIRSNGIELSLSVNEKDLQGMPYVGARIKCHAWLTGILRK